MLLDDIIWGRKYFIRDRFNYDDRCSNTSIWERYSTFIRSALLKINSESTPAIYNNTRIEISNPIREFLNKDFNIVPDHKTITNFLNIAEIILDKNILDFLEEDDIFVEENGSISIEIYHEDLKTFMSIGSNSCGYYIRRGEDILAKEKNINLNSWDAPKKINLLRNSLMRHYLNPTLAKLSYRVNYHNLSM